MAEIGRRESKLFDVSADEIMVTGMIPQNGKA